MRYLPFSMDLTGAPNVLLILATVIVVGVAFGTLARRLHMPSITGQILAGVLIGGSGLAIFDHDSVETMQPLMQFALGLMGVTVGAHLNFRKLRNAGRRLALLWFFEAVSIPIFVFAGLAFFPDMDWSVRLMFGTLAIATAPATVVALVRETGSRGVLVNTLIAGVALNNMTCLVLFEMARFVARDHLTAAGTAIPALLVSALFQLGKAASIGVGSALAAKYAQRLWGDSRGKATQGLTAILLTLGISSFLDASPLLACLFLGLSQVNLTRHRDQIVDVPFANFEPVILAVFFTVAGMELTLEYAWQAGAVALVFFLCRLAGKLFAGNVAMRAAGAPDKLVRNLGMALVPQAGVAVGLVVLLEEDRVFSQANPGILQLFVAVVLTVVVGNEVVGPILTRLALKRSGEADNVERRLIDFLEEGDIITHMSASSPKDAIRQLTDVLARSHGWSTRERDEFLASTMERESEMSTCLGAGLALPHGIHHHGEEVVGVMGLSPDGLPFETPDGELVHCIVLLATPPSQRRRHVEILAALARTVGHDDSVETRRALYNSSTAAHAYEVLTSDLAAELNYTSGSRPDPGDDEVRGGAWMGS